MELDKVTYNDLSLFQHEEEFSIFHKLNFTNTVEGREWLFRFFSNPFSDAKKISETQKILKLILSNLPQWPSIISNGTVMVMAKFYDSNIDSMPESANLMNAFNYKVFHSPDFSLVRYSISHFADFLKGMNVLIGLFDQEDAPMLLRSYLHRAKYLMTSHVVHELTARKPGKELSWKETVYYGRFIRDQFKQSTFELIDIFGRLDAWYSMAMATKHYNLSFPDFVDGDHPFINTEGLYHILLPTPVPYDVNMSKDCNFLFLTGANM